MLWRQISRGSETEGLSSGTSGSPFTSLRLHREAAPPPPLLLGLLRDGCPLLVVLGTSDQVMQKSPS